MVFTTGTTPHDSPEVILSAPLSPATMSAVVATTASHYPATTEAWTTYQAPGSVSPLSFGDSLTLPGGSSGGYPSDTEWCAERKPFSHSRGDAFNLPLQTSCIGPDGYNTSYSYQYQSGYENAASPYLDTTASNNSACQRRHSRRLEPSSSRRARRTSPLSPPPQTPSSRSNTTSKLRSASHVSKNNHINPPQTDEERKNRASHNQVEKQYRNRLNAHFEALLSTLPENMRGGDEAEDDGNKKISKAEVLEMARCHIVTLERGYAEIEEERDELRDNVERLRWMVAKSEGEGEIGLVRR